MSPAVIVWLAAMVFVGAALFVLLPRRLGHVSKVPELSREHRSTINALNDWLSEPKVVATILEHRVATRQGLQGTLERLPSMTEAQVLGVAAVLLKNRDVRGVVARYMEKAHGTPRKEVMEALLLMAAPARQEAVH